MKLQIFILLISLGHMAHARGWHDFWSKAGNTWYEKWDATLKQAEAFTEEDRMNMLGRALQIGRMRDLTSYHEDVFKRAQTTLISTSGHARYYKDKIAFLRTQAYENENKSLAEQIRIQNEGRWVGLGDYNDFREEAFSILSLLPSSEAVAVLGHFLEDTEGRNGKDMMGNPWRPSEVVPFPPNCGAAWLAITQLGIEHPPSPNKPDRNTNFFELSEVDAWKDWWNEVKEGKRTYRFIGSAIEYGPDGPATKEQVERISMHQRMESEREARHRKNSGEKHDGGPAADALVSRSPARYAIIATALALLVSIVWYFRRMKAAR